VVVKTPPVAEGRFLDDYARELAEAGERAFRRRYDVPVLIVSGRVERKTPRGSAEKTAAHRPTLQGLLNRVFPLVKAPHTPTGPVVLGRIEGADIDVVVPDASISKRHCAFATQRGSAAVSDCGSRNGTAVNGAPVTSPEGVGLAGGETITIGRLEFTFETGAGFAELVGGLGRG
jgi:hypothetical protein